MASSSTSAVITLITTLSEKLTRENHLLWKAQVLPAIRGACLYGYLGGSVKAPGMTITVEKSDKTEETVNNPAYELYGSHKISKSVSYLLNSLSKEVLTQVVNLESSNEIWTALESMNSSQSRSRVNNIRIQLSNAQKGNMTAAAYLSKMKNLGDELAAAGKPLEEDEMVLYILAGLDINYNPLVTTTKRPTGGGQKKKLVAVVLPATNTAPLVQCPPVAGKHRHWFYCPRQPPW